MLFILRVQFGEGLVKVVVLLLYDLVTSTMTSSTVRDIEESILQRYATCCVVTSDRPGMIHHLCCAQASAVYGPAVAEQRLPSCVSCSFKPPKLPEADSRGVHAAAALVARNYSGLGPRFAPRNCPSECLVITSR